ncbi:MAG: cation:proton antiporter [Gemmatimonadota bacterium]|nr:cation:proton antiporter [Gemmatimonadota bacterium]
MGAPEHFLRDLAVVLVTAGATTLLFHRLRWPVVAGYLVAGVLVGPSFTPTWLSDEQSIRLLSELGVILLMYSIGLDFRLGRLARAGPAAGLAALVEIGVMLALGFGVGRAYGWTTLASLFFACAVAVSSTMILAKVLEERPVERELRESLFSLTLFEDLAAMVFIAVLTATASGEGLTGAALATVIGRLLGLLALALVVGLALIPRAARWVIQLRTPETMLVSMVGFAFGVSYLARAAGFSVALGAFVAGLLVAESGGGRVVEKAIRPLRDVFAAVFFVATGMQLDIRVLTTEWPLALGLATVVLLGKPVAVTAGVFLAGRGLPTAIRAGLSLSHIGEFSFILAGVGVALGVVPSALVTAAVAVSVVTAFLASWLARMADPVARWVDRRLPHRVQMVASLYGAWVEALGKERDKARPGARVGRAARWLALDALAIAGLVVAGSTLRANLVEELARSGAGVTLASWTLALLTLLLVSPFMLGIFRVTRALGNELGEIAIPAPRPGRVDNGRAPRRMLSVAVQLAGILVTGGPIIIVTQPFLPPLSGLVVLALVLLLIGIIFWRRATDLFGHFQAGAELVVATLAKQLQAEHVEVDSVRHMLPGLGDFAPMRVAEESEGNGRTLGELNLRGRTGATVIALARGDRRIAFPEAHERIAAGDLLALTGSSEAIHAAGEILLAPAAVAGPVSSRLGG